MFFTREDRERQQRIEALLETVMENNAQASMDLFDGVMELSDVNRRLVHVLIETHPNPEDIAVEIIENIHWISGPGTNAILAVIADGPHPDPSRPVREAPGTDTASIVDWLKGKIS